MSRSGSGVLGSTVRLPNLFSNEVVQEEGDDGATRRGLVTDKLHKEGQV